MKLIVLILALAIFFGCESGPNPNLAEIGQLKIEPERGPNNSLQDVVTIYYAYDPRTELCFAYMRESAMGPALTNVPCQSLEINDVPVESLPTIVSK
ncbi:MAG: hypothetical protein ACXADB_02880 [Candidatus Hermodarchaeia archaeon]|jgi:hypothetical protein